MRLILVRFFSGVNCLRARVVRLKITSEFWTWSLVFWGIVLGEDDGFNVATDGEVGDNAHPAWRKQRNEVVQNCVGS